SVSIDVGTQLPILVSVVATNSCGDGVPSEYTVLNPCCVLDPYCATYANCDGNVPVVDNPNLMAECANVKIALVLDESSSVEPYETPMRDGVIALLNSLSCTGAELAIVEFSVAATKVTNDYIYVDDDFIENMTDYFNNIPNGPTN